MEMLAAIAQKELDGTPLTTEENTFIQEAIYSGWTGGRCSPLPLVPPQGWYSSLTYGGRLDRRPGANGGRLPYRTFGLHRESSRMGSPRRDRSG